MSVTITDIFAEARALVDADSTSYPNATLLRRINQAGRELTAKFMVVNKKIRFDDDNNTDLPIGYFDLTDGVQAYNYGGSLLTIERLEVKDISGIWHKLTLLDETSVKESLAEYKKTSGLPDEYARRGNSLFFYCPPSSSSVTCGTGSSGAKIYYANGFFDFVTDDIGTDKEPGIAQTNPFIFSYKAALPYAVSYKPQRVQFIMSEIARMESDLIEVELNKDTDTPSRMMPKIENTR